jgi:protein phosphatase
MNISIPELCLVAMIGPSGSGKSTFVSRHFKSTEVVSSDVCRAMVSDDANDQAATPDAFALLNFIAATRLKAGRLTVIDATSVQAQARKSLVGLARDHDCLPVAIVLNMPEALCLDRNAQRPDRQFGPRVVRQQADQLRRSIRGLKREGFRYVYVLNTPEEVEAVTVERVPLWTNLRHEHGPFDIIGDVHGCFDELALLLGRLGSVDSQRGRCGRNRHFCGSSSGTQSRVRWRFGGSWTGRHRRAEARDEYGDRRGGVVRCG